MKKKSAISAIGLLILLAAAGVWFILLGEEPKREKAADGNTASQSPPVNREVSQKKPVRDLRLARKSLHGQSKESGLPDDADPIQNAAKSLSGGYSDSVEAIKKQIYEKNIDSVEQIPLLDDVVQTGDKDTREFWGNDWASVDDWKKDTNGFKLEKNKDGSLVFTPDPATASRYTFFENPQEYTYDEKNREFVNEVDYYGKTIYNVVKFINDDVLVMMTISGTKVDLQIYSKNANGG
jgi:hypothetical protein